MSARHAALLAAGALFIGACARSSERVLYRDPRGLFSAEVPGSWRALGPEGVRRMTLFAPSKGTDPHPATLSVLLHPKGPDSRGAREYAASHRAGGEAAGPLGEATVAGRSALRYSVLLRSERGRSILEDAAVLEGEGGLWVILHRATESESARTRPDFEALLASLRLGP